MENNYVAQAIALEDGAYVPVYEQLKEFRSKYPNGSITTSIVNNNLDFKLGSTIIIKARVYTDHHQDVFGDGYSQVVVGEGKYGASALENCETSAIGRALRTLSIGLHSKKPDGKPNTGVTVSEVAKAKDAQVVINKQKDEVKAVKNKLEKKPDAKAYNFDLLNKEEKAEAEEIAKFIDEQKTLEELKTVGETLKQSQMSPTAMEEIRKVYNTKLRALKIVQPIEETK